jgi:hypothetical protein
MFKKLLSIVALSAIASVIHAGSAQALGLTKTDGAFRDAATNQGAFSEQVNNSNYTTFDFNDAGVPGNNKVQYSFSNGSHSTQAYSGQTGIYSDMWSPSGVNGEVNDSKYLAVFQGNDTVIEAKKGKTFKYFGFDAGAISGGNIIKFFNGDKLVKSMDYQEMNNLATLSASQHGGEKNAFLEIFSQGTEDNFNKIVLSQVGGGGFETDNHTFRIGKGAYDPTSVPEPGAILGLLTVGGMAVVKRRKSKTV